MIPEHLIRKSALLIFLGSFLVLCAIDAWYSLEKESIGSLELKDLNTKVKVRGKITGQTVLGDHLFLTLRDSTGSLKAIAFYTTQKLDPTKEYDVIGTLTLYNQELELIISEIEEIKS